MAQWFCSPEIVNRSQVSSATPGWSICPACSRRGSLTSSGAKAPRSSAMLPLLYQPGKAKRLASVKSKRFVANIDQGTIKNEKNTSFFIPTMLL